MGKVNRDIKKIRFMHYATLVFALLGLVLSITVQVENVTYTSQHINICSAITGTNGCEIVQTSIYGSHLGISNAIYGIFAFTLLSIIAVLLLRLNNITTKIRTRVRYVLYLLLSYSSILAGIISASIAVYFMYIQSQVLRAYCVFCMAVDILSVIFFFICIYWLYLLYAEYKNS